MLPFHFYKKIFLFSVLAATTYKNKNRIFKAVEQKERWLRTQRSVTSFHIVKRSTRMIPVVFVAVHREVRAKLRTAKM